MVEVSDGKVKRLSHRKLKFRVSISRYHFVSPSSLHFVSMKQDALVDTLDEK